MQKTEQAMNSVFAAVASQNIEASNSELQTHSEGPWKAVPRLPHATFIMDAYGQTVIIVMQSDEQSETHTDGNITTRTTRTIPIPHAHANAQLISAAPDLLEALKDAHPHIADDALRARIGTLIIKATGAL